MPTHFDPTLLTVWVFYWSFLSWCWIAWITSKPNILQNWRVAVLLVGLLCVTVSTTLGTCFCVHGLYAGGYAFYDRIGLMYMRWGALAALLGTIFASVGKGRGRISLAAISVLNLFFWYAAAMAP